MGVKVLIPTALRQYADNQSTVRLEGASVGEAMKNLAAKYPGLRAHLFTEGGQLRNFVNVYVNDEDIRYAGKEDTPLKDGDEVTIVPAVAGGADAAAPPTRTMSERRIADGWREVELSKDEIERFSRHLIMPEVGMEGQKRLKAGSVLLIGAGGLGSPLALYLAAAGIGRIGLVDFDVVDVTNLQRQVIHSTKDVGRPKLDSAREKMLGINPYVQVDTYETMLSTENAMEILEPYDIVIDGTDNFPTRYLVNDACVLLGKPNIYGSIFRFEGQASVFDARQGPCYRCLYPEPPPPGLVPSCAEGGVLGILPGIIGIIQATEAVKLVLGKGNPLVGRLLLFNALDMKFREMTLRKDPNCPICGDNPTVTELIDYDQFCGIGTDLDRIVLAPENEITPKALKAMQDGRESFVLVDVREPHEFEICRIPDSKLIPLGQVERRVGELDREADIVVHCRSGVRSAKAVKFLQEAGFKRVRNLVGGILRWSDEVDPTVPKY